MSVLDILEDLIDKVPVRDAGLVKKMRKLSIDQRGAVGENFITVLFKESGCQAERNTGLKNEKDYDILVDKRIKIEIKTATLTASTKAFQHESLDRTRHYDWICFLDIAPEAVFISFRSKKDLDKNWRQRVHVRPDGRGKLDLKLKDLEQDRIVNLNQFKAKIKPVLES